MSFHRASAKDFQKIPDNPIAYWASELERSKFNEIGTLAENIPVKVGLQTGCNDLFIRLWHEISFSLVGLKFSDTLSTKKSVFKWYPYNKGGEFRKWYGNNDYVVNWQNDGYAIRNYGAESGKIRSRAQNTEYYFKKAVTWTFISNGGLGVRISPQGAIFDVAGSSAFPLEINCNATVSFLVSNVGLRFIKFLNPTINYQVGDISRLPFSEGIITENTREISSNSNELAKSDWDNYETSWDFITLPILRGTTWLLDNGTTGDWKAATLEASWNNWKHYCDSAIARMQELETENNRLWIDAYGLQDELTPEVPEEEITLARADRAKDMAAFLSYAVGCMMGRFSLDAEGLIMANAGETLDDYVTRVGERKKEKGESLAEHQNTTFTIQHSTFAPDEDGIIPILDGEWFADDVVGRTIEFLKVTFGEENLEENIRFIEDSLGKSLRKYFVTDFYKNHISNERAYGYKKRPIYWLVQSPKKSFQALIYLHRYTKDTMNLVLNNYLREYEAKLENRIEYLNVTVASESSSASEKTRATKETDKIKASLKELDAWEKETLFPIASQRVELDLDDGVKANYPKFGKVLAKIPGVS